MSDREVSVYSKRLSDPVCSGDGVGVFVLTGNEITFLKKP